MINLIKGIVILFIIFNSKYILANEKKIIFTIDNKVYTSLDLENRKIYVQLKNSDINLLDKEMVRKDYISALIFKKRSEYLNIKINNNILNQFYESFFKKYEDENISNEFKEMFESISYENILKFLEIDIARKTILENYINNTREMIIEEGNILREEDIYNIEIKYYSFNKKNTILFNKNLLKINFKDIDNTNLMLLDNKIKYIYENKNIYNLKNLDKEIIKAIRDKRRVFKINKQNNLIIGEIVRTIINEDIINVDLFKIKSIQKIDNLDVKILKCNNIKDLTESNKYIIDEYLDVKYSTLNDKLKKKLLMENDIAVINKNTKAEYIILCNLKFEIDNYKKLKKQKIINKYLKDYESEFIRQKSKDYNLVLYE